MHHDILFKIFFLSSFLSRHQNNKSFRREKKNKWNGKKRALPNYLLRKKGKKKTQLRNKIKMSNETFSFCLPIFTSIAIAIARPSFGLIMPNTKIYIKGKRKMRKVMGKAKKY